MSVLSDALSSAALDALIIIGDDQKEMLRGKYIVRRCSSMPAPRSAASVRRMRQNRPEWVLRGSDRYYPMDGPVDYPVASSLGRHLMAYLGEDGFQVAAAEAESGGLPMGHAFAFIHSQLMRGPPVPVVPVLLNALYPPDQPTPDHCLAIGEAIARAVAAFPGDGRVGVIASGGLSHFVVDEQLDRAVVQALIERDQAALATLPLHKLNSGNAEFEIGSVPRARCSHYGSNGSITSRVTGRGRVPAPGSASRCGERALACRRAISPVRTVRPEARL